MKISWKETIKKIGAFRVILMVLAGVILILCSIPPLQTEESQETMKVQEDTLEMSYEKQMESRLKYILEQVEGIESAEVMITIYSGTELIPDKEEILQKEEEVNVQTDGVQRQSNSESREITTVLAQQKDGSKTPYILKEISPVVQGVLVVAEGEITPAITEQISEAVQALFHIEAHKVKVLEKKMQSEG